MERSAPADKERVNILLVDDQPAKLLSYEVILAELGENLIKASSGTDALRHLLDTKIAVVLVDVCMPDLDGFELAQMIREHPRLQDTAIILISAVFLTDLDRLKGYHSGAVDYVPVPIIPEMLRAKVRVFADLYRATEQLRRLNAELEVRVAERTADLRASAESLRSSEEQFRFLAETIPSMVWTAKPDGVLTYANQRLQDYVGEDFAAEPLQWPDLCVHPDDAARWRQQWDECRSRGQVFEIEVRKRRADGEYRWFLTRAVPRCDEAEASVVAWFGASTDIHQQKEMHEQLREADRRKDEFLAVLAHELRNPLSPILNAVNILSAQQFEHPDQAWCRDVIRRQTEHLSRLVDDLLDVSRITRGKVRLQRETVELGGVVARAIEANRPLIDMRGHLLHVELPSEPVLVDGDPLRLAQVVGNLLNNAAKYTARAGRLELRVQCDRGAAGDVWASITVRDNGLGIPKEMLPRVFDLFVQADDSLEQAQGGLGIGLSLVRSLVALHGGAVEARSEGIGRGSEFVVRLPLARAPAAPAPRAAPTVAAAGPRLVLVADDNPDSAESLAMLLRSAGHVVHTARDGLEAVAAADELRPSVVLLDVGMPRMNGYDAAREIRRRPWGRDVLLIAQTGWSQDEDRRRSSQAGFDAHFTKPVDFEALLRLVAQRGEPVANKDR